MLCFSFFFFNDTATTEIYTLSLHDALPISPHRDVAGGYAPVRTPRGDQDRGARRRLEPAEVESERPLWCRRSGEHTSELQSRPYLVCRLLLEKKKNK